MLEMLRGFVWEKVAGEQGPRREFRPKRFRLQPKRSEKRPFPVRSSIMCNRSLTVLGSSAGGKNKHLISSKSSVVTWAIPGKV